MLGRSTRTLIMHGLGYDTSSALFYYWVWFLSLQNPAWKHPMTLVLNLNAHSPTSSGGPITQLPPHAHYHLWWMCLSTTFYQNKHLLREGWGLTCISKNPGPSFDFSKQALHLRAAFNVEDETELRKQTSMATISSAFNVEDKTVQEADLDNHHNFICSSGLVSL